MKYSLTNPQNSIWLTEKFFTGTSVNNICGYVHISDAVNFKTLKQAINELVKTNDDMRLKFKEENGSCIQYLNDFKKFDIELVQLSSKKDIEKKALEMANIPFEIKDNFLFKFILFRLPNNSGGFIVNIHHIIGDSWTLGLVAKEVTNIYSQILNSTYEEKQFPSYLKYIEQEKEYINSDKFNKDKAYWDSVFNTVPEVASIPSIKEHSSKNVSCKGNRKKFVISEKQIDEIKDFCTKNKISVYNFFMAIYSLYLGRVSNLDDFVIGTPILNRTNFEQKHTMGMFISTAPLRINLENDKSFSDFSKTIASNSMSLLRHQKYPYQAILEDLRKKDSSIPNLYNIVLSYQITKTVEENSNVKYSTDWVFNGNCADDIQIHLFDLHGESSITVAYDYKSEKYDSQDISDIHNRILTIINQVISNNDILLKDIEIVTPEEKHQILYDFNNTKVDYPQDKTIVDLFEEQVEKAPDNIAVVFEDQKLTYRELNEKANYIAKQINFSNKNICILCDKSIEMIIGILSILKSGNCYVPIDPQAPNDRINFIIESTKCELLLTTKKYYLQYNAFNTMIIAYESVLTENINNSNIDNNAYIIFTSGTTGRPKGVEVLNKTIVNTLLWRKDFYNFNEKTNTLQLPSFAFDSSVEDIFTTLISGGCLTIPAHKINEVSNLIKTIKTHNITHFLITPALYKIFLESNCTSISTLKFITVAGEAFNIDLVKKHFSVFPNTRLYNEYGPTENSVCSTVYELTKDSTKIYIGKPISNSIAYIISNTGSLLPIGVPGELCFSGNGIVKGYLTHIDLTNEKFIKNPFSNGRIYKTGDLAKWCPNGNIEFIGRIDNQVKIRGYRIELNEIDSQISNYSNITQSVSVVQTINNSKFICSYIVAEKNIDTKELKKHLSMYLANYMIPTHIIQLDTLPLNINGKIDKKLLPIPSLNNKYEDIVYARNEFDKILLSLLKDLLNLENISISDNIFDLGIDSLSSITLSNNITDKLKIQISVKDIFDYPTTKDLSDYISTLSKNNNMNKIIKAKKQDYYPLSSAQKRIYYSSNLSNNSTLYNIAGGIIIDKILDVERLQESFNILINRHETLRTRFDIKNDELVQIIDNNIDFKLTLDDASTDDLNKVYKDFVKPFDLSKAPLFRTKLFKLSDDKMLLLLDMHHIISDGTSLSILLQELCDLYNGSTLSDKEIDYKDFTLWEQEQFETEEFKNSKEYWLNQFKDEIPLLNMPTINPRPSVQSFEGSNYHTKLSTNTFEKINNISKQLNITPYMLMLSCYYILLSKYTSQDDIVVGTPIVGRELPELSNMLGMFVNTLAIRNKINSSLSFEKFSKVIKENCLNSFKNQSYPFDMLVKDLKINRDTSRNPLFDVMFVYQNNGYPEINFKDINTEYFIPDNNISKFDLTLEVIPINNEYSLRFEYCTKLFNEEFIKKLSSHYINILNTILDNTTTKIADIDMISLEEKNQILYDFNNTKMGYPKEKTIVELFEEQSKKVHKNIAIEFGNKKITYKELNEKANYIAKELIKKGIKKGDIIGVYLKRNIELIISIWAILKVRAVYMPIYTGFPIDRIRYMIKDSNAKLLITNSDIEPNISKIDKFFINDFKQIKKTSKLFIKNSTSPEDLLYIIYTSGSTGRPKGVKITNTNLINFIYSFKKYYKEINYKDVFLASTNISFDVSIWELFLPLLNGAKLVLHSEEIIKDIKLYCKIIAEKDITALYIPPNILDLVYKVLNKNIENIKINKLLIGVEPIKQSTINNYFNINKDMIVVNGYGPTETTICATKLIYKNNNNNNNEIIPIGKPLKNTQIYIVNKDLKLQPIGVPGEILIAGDGVGNGYINNEEQNYKNFIIYNNKRVYKTGDIAKWNKDGIIDFICRNDDQMKISGYRIELNEINSALENYPNINKAYTTIYTIRETKSIISYFTAEMNITSTDIKSYLQAKLPVYMIPKELMQIQSFPITVNGKIDKNKLPIPTEKSINKYVAPRNEFEKKLQNILQNLLHINKIGINDNIFELGCDSLTAIKFQAEAINQNLDINYGDIFSYPTIKLLSERKREIQNCIDKEYDYTLINSLIEKNKTEKLNKLKKVKNKKMLLFGATGFLGAHILDKYLTSVKNSKVYCIIRSKNSTDPVERLKKTLQFYFNNKYDSYFGKRILVIEGDITKKNFSISNEKLENLANNINIVVNSAAIVKHYGNYENFDLINVKGTKNVVNFCKKNKKKLYHISTTSVLGMEIPSDKNTSKKHIPILDESSFYVGQKLDNVYIKSKFEAEKIIFEEILNGLEATILRVGNLTNRYSDGAFQINISENAFLNRLISIIRLGIVQESFIENTVEFTPIDCCADAIIKIINTKQNFTVLHLSNINLIDFKTLVKYINLNGYNLKFVNNKDFSNKIQSVLKNQEEKISISGIVTDLNNKKVLDNISIITPNSEITNTLLNNINFKWPKINEEYIKKYIEYLKKINYI